MRKVKDPKSRRKPKNKKIPVSSVLTKKFDPVYMQDEVAEFGTSGFARVKNGILLAGLLVIEVAPGMFKRPTVYTEEGVPLRIFKEYGYDQNGDTYMLQDKKWIKVQGSAPRNLGQVPKSAAILSRRV